MSFKRKKNLIFSKKGGMTSFTKVNCLSDHEIANRHTWRRSKIDEFVETKKIRTTFQLFRYIKNNFLTNNISRKFSDHCFKNADIWKKNHLQKWTRVRHHFCVFWPPLWPLRLLLYILLYYKWTTLSIRCGWIIFLRTKILNPKIHTGHDKWMILPKFP